MSQKDVPPEHHLLLEALLKDPKKRKLVLQVLGAGEEGFNKFRHEQLRKEKERNCESPTAMMRRRQLAKQNLDSDTSSSEHSSELPAPVSTPVSIKSQRPFHELLKGVTAYVEVRRNNEDKSEGIKMIMMGMGATVKDKFSSDVTHVVFKDGSYTTFQKAKLVKAHLVSVLWLDAVRRNNMRVPEKNYPAIGGEYSDMDVSVLCSQLQKDFEDIITDERRRSLSIVGNKASSSEKDRRRTMFSLCSQSSQYSKSSDSTKDSNNATIVSNVTQDGDLTNEADKEIEQVMTSDVIETAPFMQIASPELTSDDSDCGVVDGYNSSHLKEKFFRMQAELSVKNTSSNDSKSMITTCGKNIRRRETINVISDMVITPNFDPATVNMNQSKSTKSTNISEESARRKLLSDFDDTTMSSLRFSPESNKENSSLATKEVVHHRGSREFSGKSNNDNSSSSKKGKGNTKARNNVIDKTPASKPPMASPDSMISSMSSLRLSTPNSKVSLDGNTSLSKSSLNPVVLLKRTPDEQISEMFQKPKRMCASAAPKCREKTSPRRSARKAQTVAKKRTNDSEKNSPIRRSARKALEYDGETTSKRTKAMSQTPAQSTSSPQKRRNLDEAGKSTKKTRKLYDPDEVALARISASNEERERQAKLQELKSKASNKQTPSQPSSQPTAVFKTPAAVARKKSPERSTESPDIRAIIGTLNELFRSEGDKKNNKKAAKKGNIPEKDVSEVLGYKYLEKAAPSEDSSSDFSTSNSSSSKPSTSTDASTIPITPIKRRSTMDFQTSSGRATKNMKHRRLLEEMKKPSIVCTMFHRNESQNFERAVNELGHFRTEVRVTEKTTHLVVGEAKRTVNLLKAIARGVWILKHEWLLDSQRQRRWLDEERYELTEFSKAVQEMRLQRQAFGPGYTMDIFEGCGPIFVSNNTKPDSTDLKDLIVICGGKLTTMYRNASIVVGQSVRQDDVKCVSELWVLDSITANRLKPVKKYLLKPCNDELNTSRPLSPCY